MEDLCVTAKKVFDMQSCIISIIVPCDHIPINFSIQDLQSICDTIQELEIGQDNNSFEPINFLDLMDESILKVDETLISEPILNSEISAYEWVFPNGATVILKPCNLDIDVEKFGFGIQCKISASGKGLAEVYALNKEKYFSASLASYLALKQGIAGLSLSQSVSLPVNSCIFLESIESGLWEREIKVGCLPSSFETMLQYIHCLFTIHKPWNMETCRREIEILKFIINQTNETPEQKLQNFLKRVNLENSTLVRDMKVEDLKDIDFEFSYNYFKSCFSNPAEFTFAFVGNFNEIKKIAFFLYKYIKTIPTLNSPPPNPQEELNIAEKIVRSLKLDFPKGMRKDIIFAGKDPIAQVQFTFPIFPTRSSLENCVTFMCAHILEARLREVLRIHLGGVYTVSVYPNYPFSYMFPGQNIISFSCASEQASYLIEATLQTLNSLRVQGPSPTELLETCTIFEKKQQMTLQTRNHWLSNLSNLQTNNSEEEKLNNLVNLVGFIALKDGLSGLMMEHAISFFGQLYSESNYHIAILLPETHKSSRILETLKLQEFQIAS